jgi:hypothetical protein
VPLRSVEAASRDDAIAAAREQFGPHARVVGVRRVRSGGVLGFFATERYVAEVAETVPDTAGRTAAPSRTRPDDVPPADFSSPLASAAPARARAAAPARNGAAAWAAEAAARTTDDIPAEVRAAAAAARAARSTAAHRPASPAVAPAPAPPRAAAPARPASAAATPRADDERVSELVGLLAGQQAESAAPAYSRATFPRASFPRTGPVTRPDDVDGPGPLVRDGDQRIIPAAPPAPSPFTAALARMVAGDQDVRQAVQEALARPAETRPRDDAEPWPGRPEPVRPADSSVPPAARQEEETVGDQVIAPPSTTDGAVEVPRWVAEPEVAAASSASSREEAIADLLRGALAQGHSDEALAGILRKVLAGASPSTALTEPETALPTELVPAGPVFAVPSEPALAEPVLAEPVFAVPVLAMPREPVPAMPTEPVPAGPVFAVPSEPAISQPAPAEPVLTQPAFAVPDVAVPEVEVPLPVLDAPAVVEPARATSTLGSAAAPVEEAAPLPASRFPSTPVDRMWGTPSASAPLWGEATSPAAALVAQTQVPIWTEVGPVEPVSAPLFPGSLTVEPAIGTASGAGTEDVAEAPVEAAAVDAAVVEAAVVEAPVVEVFAIEAPVIDVPVVETPVAEDEVDADAATQTAEESVAESFEETGIAELAPLLARTASDPAPLMSLDATTVMPPLSLLPPLPSSRGRGRPPVPPVAPRPSASSSSRASVRTDAAPTEPTGAASGTAAESPSAEALVPAVHAPAPAAPAAMARSLATVTRLPVAPLMAGLEIPELPEDVDTFDAEELLPSVITAQPAAAPTEIGPHDVLGRLEILGVPGELLGGTFAGDVAGRGTYAALTRSLALRLPQAPEMPSGAGEVVFVVGPGVDALRAARSLAASQRLDPDRVQWATRGDLAGLAPKGSRVTTVDAAIDRHQESAVAGTVTIVAVDAPLRTDAYWMAQMMTIWSPVAVWAVVDATRKPEDLEPWIDGLPRVDALIVQDTDLSADPAAVLRRVNAPVALLDGVRATPHRWASLLCERLENATT